MGHAAGRMLVAVLALVALAACASGGGTATTDGQGDVVQFIDIRNEASEAVVVTARVGASPEQQLGFLGPAEGRRFQISTGAAANDELFLRARNPDTGREATATLTLAPGQTLAWAIRF